MMSDIFSSFDPLMFNSILPLPMFLVMNMMIIMTLYMSFWMNQVRKMHMLTIMMQIMMDQLLRTMMIKIKGLTNIISSLFMMLIMVNLFGLNPYTFSSSSHLIMTLILGLPLWMSMIGSSLMKFPMMFIAHFLPDGAPTWLNPFLVLIESVSVTVRPLTLSFRLAANMSAGHIVLTLIGLYAATAVFSSWVLMLILLSIMLMYILFETAICGIQGYIFCLLLSLYSDDHAHAYMK